MKTLVEVITAVALFCCVAATNAAFASGKTGVQAGGLSCAFSMPKTASPAARCAAIGRQCGAKFYASYRGDKLLSAM